MISCNSQHPSIFAAGYLWVEEVFLYSAALAYLGTHHTKGHKGGAYFSSQH